MAAGKNKPESAGTYPAMACMAVLMALVSCATVPEGPLGFRILADEKRYEFLQTQGRDISLDVRNAFMEGLVIPGMDREWVLQLYGRPDRITDRSWEYFDGKGKTVLKVFFEKDTVDSVYTITRPH